jgi:hypothetical protein
MSTYSNSSEGDRGDVLAAFSSNFNHFVTPSIIRSCFQFCLIVLIFMLCTELTVWIKVAAKGGYEDTFEFVLSVVIPMIGATFQFVGQVVCLRIGIEVVMVLFRIEENSRDLISVVHLENEKSREQSSRLQRTMRRLASAPSVSVSKDSVEREPAHTMKEKSDISSGRYVIDEDSI